MCTDITLCVTTCSEVATVKGMGRLGHAKCIHVCRQIVPTPHSPYWTRFLACTSWLSIPPRTVGGKLCGELCGGSVWGAVRGSCVGGAAWELWGVLCEGPLPPVVPAQWGFTTTLSPTAPVQSLPLSPPTAAVR